MAKKLEIMMTTGVNPLADKKNPITAGPRSPLLMQDYQRLEKRVPPQRPRRPGRWMAFSGTFSSDNPPTRRVTMKTLSKSFYAMAAFIWLSSTFSRLAAGTVTTVSVQDDVFVPSSSSIQAGDTIVWHWDGSDHNVTSTSHPEAWTATATVSSTTFTFTNTFNTAGTFPYECTIHADIGMLGTINVAAASSPPTVSITNPTNAAVFSAPANVAITAIASVSGGTVTNVAFFDATSLLGSARTAPFNFTALNLPVGDHSLTAVATAAGVSATSSVVNITVVAPLSPPNVTITDPVSGALLAAPASVSIAATTTDTDGTVTNVEFLVGSTILSNRTAAPFTAVTNNLPAGSYILSAIATDNNGLKATNTASIQVFTPIALASGAKSTATSFQFSYPANSGLSYVVQRSTDLGTWISLSTNTATANPTIFSDTNATNNSAFYRVGLMPNP
jgi:plastocyanin